MATSAIDDDLWIVMISTGPGGLRLLLRQQRTAESRPGILYLTFSCATLGPLQLPAVSNTRLTVALMFIGGSCPKAATTVVPAQSGKPL